MNTPSWTSTTYKNLPFDYVTNAAGATHGNGQDCAMCHSGPGTGSWGTNQNWVGGGYGGGTGVLMAWQQFLANQVRLGAMRNDVKLVCIDD